MADLAFPLMFMFPKIEMLKSMNGFSQFFNKCQVGGLFSLHGIDEHFMQ
jgi:hypothetical protein